MTQRRNEIEMKGDGRRDTLVGGYKEKRGQKWERKPRYGNTELRTTKYMLLRRNGERDTRGK